ARQHLPCWVSHSSPQRVDNHAVARIGSRGLILQGLVAWLMRCQLARRVATSSACACRVIRPLDPGADAICHAAERSTSANFVSCLPLLRIVPEQLSPRYRADPTSQMIVSYNAGCPHPAR